MAVMYHVSTDPAVLGSMSEDAFYDSADALGADYVQDQDEERSRHPIDVLYNALKAAGFHPVRVDDPEDHEAFRFRSGKDQAAMDGRKDAWFQDQFQRLQAKAASMTLADFARSTGPAYDLMEMVNDRFGDHVHLDMGTGPASYTLPSFIRNMEPDTLYYVAANTVYLH